MSDHSEPGRQGEVKTYKALPRDPNQKEHKKPRAFIHRPDEDSEAADEARRKASYTEAVQTIKTEDFRLEKVAQQPCVRNALLPGIGGGFGIGAARFVLGGSIMTACNWASGSFVGISIIAYNYCQRRRSLEKEGIRKAVKVLDAKQAIKDSRGTLQPNVPASEESPPSPSSTISPGSNTNGKGVSFWQSFRFW